MTVTQLTIARNVSGSNTAEVVPRLLSLPPTSVRQDRRPFT
jgi:hypothetical protein